MTTPTPPSPRGWRHRTWRGPSARWLTVASLLIIVALIGLLIATLAGFSQGLAARQQAVQAEIDQRLSAGIEQMQARRLEQAAAELQRVLQLDPANSVAQGHLQGMQVAVTPQPTALIAPLLLVPPEGATPMPTLELVILPTDGLFGQAETALARATWRSSTGSTRRF